MQITAPETRPEPGVTIPIAEARLIKSGIIARTRCGHDFSIVPINAFPRGESYSRATRSAINELLKQSGNLSLTIPTPTSMQHPNWIKHLSKGTAKPGWLWISDTETVNMQMLRHKDVEAAPPYPTRVHQLPNLRPHSRPGNQITMQCRVMEHTDSDLVRCMGSDNHELPIALIDCYHRGKWTDFVCQVLHRYGTCYTVPLPPGQSISDWLDDLRHSHAMAGWLWMHNTRTLNQWLVMRGFATHAPT